MLNRCGTISTKIAPEKKFNSFVLVLMKNGKIAFSADELIVLTSALRWNLYSSILDLIPCDSCVGKWFICDVHLTFSYLIRFMKYRNKQRPIFCYTHTRDSIDHPFVLSVIKIYIVSVVHWPYNVLEYAANVIRGW